MTLTLRHTKDDALAALMAALLDGWRSATQGQKVKRLMREAGVTGRVRAIEVLHGHNGWHPHIHVLFFLQGRLDDQVDAYDGRRKPSLRITRKEAMDRLADDMFDRWRAAAQRGGLSAPTRARGLDWRAVSSTDDLPSYLTKQVALKRPASIAAEMAQGGTKRGRRGGRTQWEVVQRIEQLRRVVFAQRPNGPSGLDELREVDEVYGQVGDRGPTPIPEKHLMQQSAEGRRLDLELRLWREFESATHGVSPLRWSQGLVEEVEKMGGPSIAELTDEDIVTQATSDRTRLATIGIDDYQRLRARHPEALADIRFVAGLGTPWVAQALVLLVCESYDVHADPCELDSPPPDGLLEVPSYVPPMPRGERDVLGYDQWHRRVYE